VILRVKKRGDGRSASPTVRLKGERAPSERIPWELFGGPLGAVAPPASFNVQEVPAQTDRVATPVRARVMEGGGMVCGVFGWWEVGGGEGGGEMVLWGWF
jgi:hypothetical protein